jgi:hypothetical protein
MVVAGAGAARTVSVALATFRGARYLPPLLDSLAAQLRLPDELVVADDASDDDTAAIIEGFAGSAPFPVKLVRQPRNVGVLENFYTAFRATTGRIIFYCDQDDVWDPAKIERLVAPFEDAAVHFAAHRSLVVDERLSGTEIIPRNARYGTIAFPANALNLYAHGHQMAFDRAVLDVMEALRPHLATAAPTLANNLDAYIPFCASLLGDIHLSSEPLVQFRRHAGSVSPLSKGEAHQSRLTRMADAADQAVIALQQRHALLELPKTELPIDSTRLRTVSAALERDLRVGRAIAAVRSGNRAARFARLACAAFEIVRPGPQFSNRRRVREAARAAASFLSPQPIDQK